MPVTLFAFLTAADIAFGAVNDVSDLSSHRQLKRITVDTPAGPVSYAAAPLRRSGETFEAGAVPVLGEHSDAIRKEFQQAAREYAQDNKDG